METKRIGDFQPKRHDCDNKVKTEDILGKDMLLIAVEECQGTEGVYLSMLISQPDGENKAVWNCGGKVVVRKIKEAQSRTKLPLLFKVVKIARYFDIA